MSRSSSQDRGKEVVECDPDPDCYGRWPVRWDDVWNAYFKSGSIEPSIWTSRTTAAGTARLKCPRPTLTNRLSRGPAVTVVAERAPLSSTSPPPSPLCALTLSLSSLSPEERAIAIVVVARQPATLLTKRRAGDLSLLRLGIERHTVYSNKSLSRWLIIHGMANVFAIR